jgi:hypothetical protein
MTENNTGHRPIPGYEGRYEMDRDGNVYALFPFKGQPSGRKMNTFRDSLGYVKLSLTHNGQMKQHTVHRLLMLTWCPIENAHEREVNHIDGNKGNNDLSNLEWVTRRENMLHAHFVIKSWTHSQVKGEQINTAKLTEDKVREIRRLFKDGQTFQDLAVKFGVTPSNISYIVRGLTWRHVAS